MNLYWLPQAISNGFDMDNTVVFIMEGGGDLIKAGDPQLEEAKRGEEELK